jgi:hypothetical protein
VSSLICVYLCMKHMSEWHELSEHAAALVGCRESGDVMSCR